MPDPSSLALQPEETPARIERRSDAAARTRHSSLGGEGETTSGTGGAGPLPKSRRRRGLWIGLQVSLGLVAGLAVAEYAAYSRDDGAFPHVNFYEADAELGARLEPGASMRFRLHDNPVTTIHVNAQGFRGADWPAAAPGDNDEVLVLGDSQVFGLGVEDGETFSARLAELTGRPVLNAGVPTYGPPEYLALGKRLMAERKPKTLVYVVNFLNDPFELNRPNGERHAIWDGWAVRAETAPGSVTAFPGRRWLMSQSHLVYAARRWAHERGRVETPTAVDLGVPSEGRWQDLVHRGARVQSEMEAAASQAMSNEIAQRARLAEVERRIDAGEYELDQLIEEEFYEWDSFQQDIARAQPGDIVTQDLGESGRSVQATAAHIRKAARERKRYADRIRKEKRGAGARRAQSLVEDTEALRSEREALRIAVARGIPRDDGPRSVFDAHIAELASACAANGVELVVVALPVDVQVSAEEWKKYGVVEAPDMEPSLALLDDLVRTSESHGARALNATAALREAEPGAFLNGDIHMTAKGHAALAGALAESLARPPGMKLPKPGLAEGRSFPPAREEWQVDDEVLVRGSTKAGCSTQIHGDWFRLKCARRSRTSKASTVPTAIELTRGDADASLVLATHDGVSLVAPLVVGDALEARISWSDRSRALRISWPEGKFSGEIVELEGDAEGAGRPRVPDPLADLLCECHGLATEQADCVQHGDEWESWLEDCRPTCSELWGRPEPSCFETYLGAPDPKTQAFTLSSDDRKRRDQCTQLLACAQADPLVPPKCEDGEVLVGPTQRCMKACDAAHPCETGRCEPHRGGGICR